MMPTHNTETPQEDSPEKAAGVAEKSSADTEGDGIHNDFGEQPNVSPEDQQMYDLVVHAAMDMMYQGTSMSTLAERLVKEKDNLSGSIGHTAAMILQSIDRTWQKQDKQMPEEVLFAAGQEIVSQLADVAVALKLVTEEDSQKLAEESLFEGMRVWGAKMQQMGEITDERQMSAQEQLRDAKIKLTDFGRAQQQDQGAAPPGAPQAGVQSAVPPTSNQPPQGGIINAAGAQ